MFAIHQTGSPQCLSCYEDGRRLEMRRATPIIGIEAPVFRTTVGTVEVEDMEVNSKDDTSDRLGRRGFYVFQALMLCKFATLCASSTSGATGM